MEGVFDRRFDGGPCDVRRSAHGDDLMVAGGTRHRRDSGIAESSDKFDRVRPRIALITHTSVLSGAEIALERLVGQLDRERFDPVVFAFADGPLVERLRAAGVETHVVTLPEGIASTARQSVSTFRPLRHAWHLLLFVTRLAVRLRAARVNLLHAHSLKSDLLTAAAAPFVGRPMVWHVHDRISPDYLPVPVARAFRILARLLPAHVVVNSLSTLSTLAPLRRYTVAYPGLSDDAFERDVDERPMLDRPVVGMLGRIGPTKGQMQFLQATRTVLQRHPGTTFRVVGAPLFGETEYLDSLRSFAEERLLADSVQLTGFSSDPRAEMAKFSVFVHASPVPEPFGQVIIEALALGIPVVATDAGGAAEIMRDEGRTLGRLVEPGSVDQLAAAICDALDERETDRQTRQFALDSVRRRFPISRTASAVMDTWDQVLTSSRRAGLPSSSDRGRTHLGVRRRVVTRLSSYPRSASERCEDADA